MKVKYFFVPLTFIFILLFFSSTVMAGRGCTGPNIDPENFIVVDINAPGTKYDAVLTIYYDENASCATSFISSNMRDMRFFMRLEGNIIQGVHWAGGTELVPFAGVAECIPYWNGAGYTAEEAVELQQQAIHEFFRLIVNPALYGWNHSEDDDGCDPSSQDPDNMCPAFALKSIDKLVDGDYLNEHDMTIVDLIIAVQD